MMACDLSKSLGLSSSLKTQQGIVSILGDISSNTSSAPSLRRTFSADLSSKNWLLHNGFSPMKRISPSEKLRAFATDDEEAEEESRSGDDIWAQIQQDKNSEEEKARLGHTDVWTSILSEKKKTESVDPPYVHPLMKRASSLSEKSLNICTESLGSETGCESFSSSEIGDTEIENQEEINLVLNATETKVEEITESEIEVEHKSSITVPNHTIESFPPPIRSLSTQSGASLHMKTRRDNGRLVLEAISMPSHNNFSAKRQDGRLLLTFADEPNYEIDIGDETDSEIQPLDEEEEEETQTRDEFAYKPNGPITFHRLAHKPIRIPKSNTRWSATDEYTTKTNQSTPLVHSLPPRPRVAKPKPPSTVDDTVGAACFNTCNQFWKPNNTEAFGPNTKSRQDSWINGCKERRRSLLSVEPFCIAT